MLGVMILISSPHLTLAIIVSELYITESCWILYHLTLTIIGCGLCIITCLWSDDAKDPYDILLCKLQFVSCA